VESSRYGKQGRKKPKRDLLPARNEAPACIDIVIAKPQSIVAIGIRSVANLRQ